MYFWLSTRSNHGQMQLMCFCQGRLARVCQTALCLMQFRRDYVVSKKFIPHGDEPTWPPHFDEAAAPTAEDFARKAAEIKAAVVAEIEHEQVEAVAQVWCRYTQFPMLSRATCTQGCHMQ